MIALPLSHWPKTIWNSFINRQPKCLKNDREALKVEKHLLITNFNLYSYSIFNFHVLCVSIMRSFFKKRNKTEHYLKKALLYNHPLPLDPTLYLVSKAYQESEDSWVEWRLSFPMPEIKIIPTLPYIYRKVS